MHIRAAAYSRVTNKLKTMKIHVVERHICIERVEKSPADMNMINKQMHIVCAIVPSLCYRIVSFGEYYLAYRSPAPTLRTSADVMRLLFCLLMTSATTTTMSTIHIGYSSDMASCS